VSGADGADVAALLQALVEQQTAMLQLQRTLIERLQPRTAERMSGMAITAEASAVEASAIEPSTGEDLAGESPPLDRAAGGVTRAARYYQARPAATAPSVAPHELELLRRLQDAREASSLILQFGPHKGTSLAQVARADPDYVRHLVTRAQRPQVRAAAARLVEALDAAAMLERKSRRQRLSA
jgi:hypothetical protein